MPRGKEYYRVRAEECCRMAASVSEVEKRIHWLEAAARWLSLGREQGVLLPRKTQSRFRSTPSSREPRPARAA